SPDPGRKGHSPRAFLRPYNVLFASHSGFFGNTGVMPGIRRRTTFVGQRRSRANQGRLGRAAPPPTTRAPPYAKSAGAPSCLPVFSAPVTLWILLHTLFVVKFLMPTDQTPEDVHGQDCRTRQSG